MTTNPRTAVSSAPEHQRSAALHADRRRYEAIIDKYLSDCYAKRTPARVKELAALLGGARAHLSRVVGRLFGRPLGTVLREKQLQEAKRLLEAVTPLSMQAVASASGFGNRSTLFRRFQEAFGCTPMQYRDARARVTKCDPPPLPRRKLTRI